jgi:hypothetical protein
MRVLMIKKEIQEFIIATENLYRLLSDSKTLTCHEVEIIRCCMEELCTTGDGLSLFRSQKQK